jgi:Na+/melibiose symporter-like transporter
MRRSRLALLVALGADNFGSGLFLPLALVYATRVVGLPLGLAGTVVAVGTAAGLAVPPLAGRLVDRLGPRAVVIGAQLLQALGALAYLAADGAALTLAAAVLLAAGQQGFYSALFALIADVSPPGPKDRSFAQVNMVRSGAFGTGALAAGGLLSTLDDQGLRIAVGADAATFVVSAVLLWVFVRNRHHPSATARESSTGAARGVLRDPPYLALICVTGLIALVTDFFLVGAPVFALEQLHAPGWLPGAMLALLTVVDSTLGTTAVRRTAHLSRTGAMRAGAGLYLVWCAASVVTVLLPGSWHAGWLLVTTLLLAVGHLLIGPRANAISEAAAPRASRGRYLAAFQYSFTVPGVLAPGVVALFEVGVWTPWLVVAASALLGWFGLAWLTPRLPAHATLAGTRQG